MQDVNKMNEDDLKRIEKAHAEKSNPTQEDSEFLERVRETVKKNSSK